MEIGKIIFMCKKKRLMRKKTYMTVLTMANVYVILCMWLACEASQKVVIQ